MTPKDIKDLNAFGTDESTASDGVSPTYLYSMFDMAVLLYYLRKQTQLSQDLTNNDICEPYTENEFNIFIPHPYLAGTFEEVFIDDRRRISQGKNA